MKLFRIAPAVILLLLFTGCRNKRIIYQLENNNGVYEFQATNTDTVVKHKVNFWTSDQLEDGSEPIDINFLFSESTPNVKLFESVNIALFSVADNGTESPLPVLDDETKISFYDGKKIIEKKLRGNKEPLTKLVDWSKAEYTYEFMNQEYKLPKYTINYSFSNKFESKGYPDNLKLVVTLRWENGERKYESKLLKKEYVGRGLNLKY